MKHSENYDIPKVCEFCESATLVHDEGVVLCSRNGIVRSEYVCKKFVYDPLKRVPRTLPPMTKLTEDDLI